MNRRVGTTFWISSRHQIPPSFSERVIRSTTMESPITNSSPCRSTFPCRNPLSSNVPSGIWKNWAFQNSKLRSASLLYTPTPPRQSMLSPHSSGTSSRVELDRLCPVKTINGRAPKKNTKWLSEPAREAKRRRRRLEKKWKRTKLETDRIDYRTACREAGTLINESKRKFISDEINNCSNSKQRWSKINNILHPKNKTKLQCDINSTTFIQFFHNKIVQLGLSIKSKIISSNITVPPPDPIHTAQEFSTLPTVTPSEVSKLLASIPSKSSNLDYIPTSILKTCSSIFSPLIARLANLSFDQGQFPSDFKIAQITSLLKKPNLDPTNPANYRPISNLNNISKILERLFLFRFRPFITSSPLFNPHQSAYRQGYSTETALLFTLNNIRQSADRGKSTILVLIGSELGLWHHWPPSPSRTTKNHVWCHWPSSELAKVLPHWSHPVSQAGEMTCPHPCCSKRAYLRVQFSGRFFSHPSFHLSIASPHSLGSINNNMPMIPSCTWKFHPIHLIQVSLTSNRHSNHSHPGFYTMVWPLIQKNLKPFSLAHMQETALYPNLRSMLLVPPSLSQPPSNCLVSISTIA